MTERRGAAQDADSTAAGERVPRNGGERAGQFSAKVERGEIGSISQEAVGTERCNTVGLPEVRDREELTHSSAKEQRRRTSPRKYLITFSIGGFPRPAFRAAGQFLAQTESFEVRRCSGEQLHVPSVHISAVKHLQFGLAHSPLVSTAAASEGASVWSESLAARSPASPTGQQSDISSLLITSTCFHMRYDTQRDRRKKGLSASVKHSPLRDACKEMG